MFISRPHFVRPEKIFREKIIFDFGDKKLFFSTKKNFLAVIDGATLRFRFTDLRKFSIGIKLKYQIECRKRKKQFFSVDYRRDLFLLKKGST